VPCQQSGEYAKCADQAKKHWEKRQNSDMIGHCSNVRWDVNNEASSTLANQFFASGQSCVRAIRWTSVFVHPHRAQAR
jgi:hypothetical protein